MEDVITEGIPDNYNRILSKSEEIGFTMPSDLYIGSFLKTLVASKPGGSFLELGTGLGLSLSWMDEGMDTRSRIISVDNDPKLVEIAKSFFGEKENVELVCADGNDWIRQNEDTKFDLIFADAWPGKFNLLEETLALLKSGGYYVIDDLSPQENWPEGHREKVDRLLITLDERPDLVLTKMNWSTGLILATKK
ncbi:MAG: class I SAM-dependent methyltransferase [Cyclobacteriaceae bacterium]